MLQREEKKRNTDTINEMKDIKIGDWITVVDKDDCEEDGSVFSFDDDVISIFDGKEGLSFKWEDVKEIKKELN